MRGSPYLHALIWTKDCPKLTHETKQEYIDYVDQYVQAYLPDRDTDPELYELVKETQQILTRVTNCYHYTSSRYPGPIETLSREIFSSRNLIYILCSSLFLHLAHRIQYYCIPRILLRF